MRIRPWVVTGFSAVCAGTALGIVVSFNDPAVVGPLVRVLFWGALFLSVWSASATLLLWVKMTLPRAIGISLLWAASGAGIVIAWRSGVRDWRLLGGLLFATLLISLFIFFRSRKLTPSA